MRLVLRTTRSKPAGDFSAGELAYDPERKVVMLCLCTDTARPQAWIPLFRDHPEWTTVRSRKLLRFGSLFPLLLVELE